MSVLYHFTIIPPARPECEAISQEVAALRRRFGGEVVYLNPNHRSPVYIPRLLFGFHLWRRLRRLEEAHRLHHLYNPDPFPFPILRTLRRPVVYSLTGGVYRRPNVSFFARLGAVTVADEASAARLRAWGLGNVHRVRPGVDTRRFTFHPLPLGDEVRLLVGSAPWTRAQFRSKGVDALLEAARRSPRLRLTFLWRGVLGEEMARRVREMGLTERVVVLDEVVDVNRVLAGVHGAVTLAAAPDIVKTYPHSLLESLAAGKPVLVSRAIPMAEYVERVGCGVVVDEVTAEAVLAAVESLRGRYAEAQSSARAAGRRDFTLEGMVDSFRRVYEQVAG